MAVLALSAAGAIAGSFIPGTFIGLTGAQIGWMVGGIVGNALYGPEGTDTHGPRLDDNTFNGDVEGTDIPILWGGDRMIGKPIWIKTPPTEIITKEETGGKGSSPTNTYYTYTYYQSVAFCFGEFISSAPRRVWLNGELFYDVSGGNVAVNKGISFVWHSGNSSEIDSIIEQDVGIGNCPSYKNRSVMTIEGLNLTEKFGNRLPIVEAEIQTTGNVSNSYTSYNMGESIGSSFFYGVDFYVRHPTNNTVICNPLIYSGAYVSCELFFVDLASQYIRRFWAGSSSTQIGYVLCSDSGSYNKNKITHLILSQTCISCSSGILFKISYPEGQTLNISTFASFNGGCSIPLYESHLYLIGAARLGGGTFSYINKNTLQPETIYDINTLITPSDTGWNAVYFVEGAVCIDWENSTWGVIAQRTGRKAAYYVIEKDSILGPTVTWKSNVFDFITTDQTLNETFHIPGVRAGFYDEINNEVWHPWTTSDTTLGYELGLICLDATTGAQLYFIDFVQAGYTTGSAYWGSLSGYPVLGFDQTTRTLWWTLSGTGHTGTINIDSKKIKWYGNLPVPPGSSGAWKMPYGNRNTVWSGTELTDDFVLYEISLGTISQGTIAISTIIADICERMGISSSEYDVSTLTSKVIGSFVHSTRHSARSDIELLLGIAIADGIESDYTLKFPLRGGSVIETLPNDDLAAQELNGQIEPVDSSIVTLPLDLEIPKVYEIVYRSINNLYNKGIKNSYIATGSNIDKQTSQLPVALYDKAAGDLCQKYHQQLIDVKQYKFSLPIKYMYLEVSDIIEVPKNGKNYRVKLTRIDIGTNWILNCEGVSDFSENYVANAIVAGVDDFIGTIDIQTNPNILILDGPLLRDIDSDHPGPYLTSFVYTGNYPLSSWFYSVDDSVFSPISAQNIQPIVAQSLAAGNTTIWEDWSSTILYMELLNDGSLSSSTKSAILADPTINAFAYGAEGRWEYINVATVTLISSTPTKRYQLTDILRGRRGTDNNINNHVTGDRLIQLSSDTSIIRQTLQNSQISNTLYYKIPRHDQAVSDVDSKSIVIQGTQLKPYSPIQVEGVLDGSDINLGWTRRTRKGGSLGGDNTLTDGVGGPLNEDTEAYEIDITNFTTGAVLETYEATTVAKTYSSSEQTADGSISLGHFYIDVYQMSSVVGRGFRGRGLYDKGWAKVITAGVDLDAKAILPLDDVTGGNAQDWITSTNIGTYTSATSNDGISSDGLSSLKCDGSGYVKLGTSLKTLLDGKSAGTVLVFKRNGGNNADINLQLTKGDIASRVNLYSGQSYERVWWGAKTGTGVLGINGKNDVNRLYGHCCMIASSCYMDGTGIYLSISYNGTNEYASSGGTGHSAYATTFQSNSRNSAYNDTINGSLATSPSNIGSNGAIGLIMVFDKVLSLSELRSIYVSAFARHTEYIDNLSLLYHCPMDDSGLPATLVARVGSGSMTVVATSTSYPSCMSGGEYGCYQPLITTGRSIYKELTSEFKIQTFTVGMWIELVDNTRANTSLTGTHAVISLSPRDWNGTVKKGVHITVDSTNGLEMNVGAGGASFQTISSGTNNIVAGGKYLLMATFDTTNGVKLYLNGSSVGTPLSALTVDWTDGGTGGPSPGQIYLNADNTNTSITSTNVQGIKGRMQSFYFFDEELTASQVTDIYNIGSGKG